MSKRFHAWIAKISLRIKPFVAHSVDEWKKKISVARPNYARQSSQSPYRSRSPKKIRTSHEVPEPSESINKSLSNRDVDKNYGSANAHRIKFGYIAFPNRSPA